MDLRKVRNIGISAHIDSGKTTLSERILFYAGRIHKIEDVRGGGGANAESVVKQVREKLGADACPMQIPVGREDEFKGVIDLISMKALYFDGSNGEKIRTEEIPADLKEEAAGARTHMLESLSM